VGTQRLATDHQSIFDAGDLVLALHGYVRGWDLSRISDAQPLPLPVVEFLQAFRQDEARAVGALYGEWAAIVCSRASGRIVLARDPFGCRPLVWTDSNGGVVAAAEPHQLLRGLTRDPKLDEDYLVRSFTLTPVSDARTYFQSVRQVPPGRVCRLSDLGPSVETAVATTFAEIPPECETGPAGSRSSQLEELGDLVGRVAAESTVSTDCAIALSGGLDSATIYAYLRRSDGPDPRAGRLLRPISVTFPGLECDESLRIGEIETALGGTVVRLDLSSEDPFEAFYQEVRKADWPLTVNSFWIRRLAAAAIACGASALVTGIGGDEIFWEHDSVLRGLLVRGDFSRTIRLLLGESSMPTTKRLVALGRALQGAFLPRAFDRVGVSPMTRLLAAKWKKKVEEWSSGRGRDEPDSSKGFRKALACHQAGWALLPLEAALARAGLEPRSPFLDWRLVKAVRSFPPEDRFSGGITKPLLRRVAPRSLPLSVREYWRKESYLCLYEDRIRTAAAAAIVEMSRLVELGIVELKELRELRTAASQGSRVEDLWLWLEIVLTEGRLRAFH